MSNETLNPANPGAETLPASTPEYAPVVQVIVEDVPEGKIHTTAVETPPAVPLPDNSPYAAPREPEPQETPAIPTTPITPAIPEVPTMPVTPITPVMPTTPVAPVSPITPVSPVPPANPAASSDIFADAQPASAPAATYSPEKRLYELLLEEFSRDPRFGLHTNLRALTQEVQSLKSMTQHVGGSASIGEDLASIRKTVEKIWTYLEGENVGAQFIAPGSVLAPHAQPSTVNSQPSAELIAETRALIRSVNEEVNATRNTVIQLTNQGRMMLDVATRCLREMDKTAQKYAQQEQPGEPNPLLDELRSLRDMLADGFENARLEPIVPEPGEPFRYSDHRADNGSASAGKIKRTVFPGFRWTQPNPPVVLMPAVVETE